MDHLDNWQCWGGRHHFLGSGWGVEVGFSNYLYSVNSDQALGGEWEMDALLTVVPDHLFGWGGFWGFSTISFSANGRAADLMIFDD